MVEDVVEVDANFELRRFAKPEELAQTEVHAPRAWSNQRVAFRDLGVIKNIGARGGKIEGRRVEKPVATNPGIRIADQARTETWTTEIADRVNKAAGDVARENGIAVVAVPVRRETRAALREHVPCDLITSKDTLFPLGSCFAKVPSLTERNIERAIRHQAVT